MIIHIPDSNVRAVIKDNIISFVAEDDRSMLELNAEQAKGVADFINEYHKETTTVVHSFNGPRW